MTAMELPTELPQLHRRHVYSCHTQGPPMHPRGSCGVGGAQPLWERLGERIEEEGLGQTEGCTAAGCLGFKSGL